MRSRSQDILALRTSVEYEAQQSLASAMTTSDKHTDVDVEFQSNQNIYFVSKIHNVKTTRAGNAMTRTLYPEMDQRTGAPSILVPAYYFIFALAACTSSFPARLSILILLLVVSASSPCFRGKDLNEDYSRGLPSFAIPIFFMDLLLLSQDEAVRFLGAGEKIENSEANAAKRVPDTFWPKLRQGFRLVCSFRGIGWSFQVKGVPQHPDSNKPRWEFVLKYLFLSGVSWSYKFAFQYLIGMATTVKSLTTSGTVHVACNVVEGWSGALWAAVGLNQFYRLGAAITVAVGICETWEWPPFFGTIQESWSVRQIWSSVWHQLLRRILQRPGVVLARSLGVQKGTAASSYLQLYTAFTISTLLHAWCMFNATHGSAGEFQFFMAQPLAITSEDLVQWFWRKSRMHGKYSKLTCAIGHAWVFVWFSYCLPSFVQRQRAVGIMGGDFGGDWAMSYGQKHGMLLGDFFQLM